MDYDNNQLTKQIIDQAFHIEKLRKELADAQIKAARWEKDHKIVADRYMNILSQYEDMDRAYWDEKAETDKLALENTKLMARLKNEIPVE